MATLQDCVDDMAAEATLIGTVSAFIAGLQAQIAAIPGITPAVQAQIDAVFAAAEANKTALAAVMVPAVVTPPPTVTPAP